jgi:hypothetical protein
LSLCYREVLCIAEKKVAQVWQTQCSCRRLAHELPQEEVLPSHALVSLAYLHNHVFAVYLYLHHHESDSAHPPQDPGSCMDYLFAWNKHCIWVN